MDAATVKKHVAQFDSKHIANAVKVNAALESAISHFPQQFLGRVEALGMIESRLLNAERVRAFGFPEQLLCLGDSPRLGVQLFGNLRPEFG